MPPTRAPPGRAALAGTARLEDLVLVAPHPPPPRPIGRGPTDAPSEPVGPNPPTSQRRTRDMRFDLDQLKRRAARLDDRDIDYGTFAREPLDEDALRCLRYMHDVEFHTACYLRDILVTRAHAEPEITAFLSIWAFEELWHGEAIEAVLRAHGEPAGAERIRDVRSAGAWRSVLAPAGTALASLASRHVVAVLMAWGAVNELVTQAGYGRLARRAHHPVLSALLQRIMRQEGRHIDFYASEAARRLDGEPGAQRLTRLALRLRWAPVGSSIMPRAEVAHLCHHLFSDEEGRRALHRIDRHVDRLPGLAGLRLAERAAGRLLVTGAPTPVR